MLSGLHYAPNGSLHDDTGHSWNRVRRWVEPDEAETLVHGGTRYVVQTCRSRPRRGRVERFKRDILRNMLASSQAEGYADAREVPNVMVGELWRSERDGDLLLFVLQGPFPRSRHELADDW